MFRLYLVYSFYTENWVAGLAVVPIVIILKIYDAWVYKDRLDCMLNDDV